MTVAASDIQIVHAEFHPVDMFRKEGGYHTSQEISDIVDSVFQPGVILESDASDIETLQYRKVFAKNLSGESIYHVKVYGFNNKTTNYVKFALERDILGNIKINGSEVIKDYKTAPRFTSDLSFTEIVDPNDALDIGNSGKLSDLDAQGIWLKMTIPRNVSDLASDEFCLGVNWTETE